MAGNKSQPLTAAQLRGRLAQSEKRRQEDERFWLSREEQSRNHVQALRTRWWMLKRLVAELIEVTGSYPDEAQLRLASLGATADLDAIIKATAAADGDPNAQPKAEAQAAS